MTLCNLSYLQMTGQVIFWQLLCYVLPSQAPGEPRVLTALTDQSLCGNSAGT